jgi:hypothetical protein
MVGSGRPPIGPTLPSPPRGSRSPISNRVSISAVTTSLLVHPANHNLILGAVSGTGAGILKSANGGLSWQLLANGLFEGSVLGSIAVHPSNTQIMYISVWSGGPGAGLYKSTDGGLNWQNTTMFHAGFVTDVIVAKFNPQILYAGLVANGDGGMERLRCVYASGTR